MRRATTYLLCLAALSSILLAQSLTARIDRDRLRLAAPRLHFLIGEALERLRNGATVKYDFQLTLRTEKSGKAVAREQQQFAVSYDLWEEKFAITKLGPSPRSVSHLSAAAAETWCVDNISLPVSTVTTSQPFWLRLDFRADESGGANDQTENSGFTLSGLIDIFSRRARGEQVHGFEEVGPLRLDSLTKK